VLRHRIADLATEIECCRLLVYATAHQVDRAPSRVLPRESSMVKLKTTEVARAMALAGMQMMGRLRLRHRVRHGTPRPRDAHLHCLRWHERDPARHHRQTYGL
jgi:alkylation response protein AidB-like acyl-CoA dehydrogenase